MRTNDARPGIPAYLYLRGKLALRLLVPALCVTALLLLALGLLGFAASRDRTGDEARVRVSMGVVYNDGDRYLSMGLYALETMDRSRLALELVQLDEAEAASRLRQGTLDAYLVIPDGFVEALFAGETRPLRYVTDAAAGLGATLTDELVRAVARLLLETENAIYGAQSYAAERLDGVDPYALGDRLTRVYLNSILDRDGLYVTETLGVGEGLDFFHYYLCALIVLFLLLWGLLAAPLFARESLAPRRALAAAGFGALRQLVCEYLVYTLLLLCCYMLTLGLLLLAARLPALRELLPERPARLAVYALRAVVPALVFAAMQLLFHELSAGSVGALLLQFLAAAAMAFVSGCFYPSSALPTGMQTLGRLLPTGAGMAYLAAPSAASLGLLAFWLLLCFALLWLLRRRRLEGGAA